MTPAAGRSAPPLELPDLDGRPVRLADLRGVPVLAVFLRHAG